MLTIGGVAVHAERLGIGGIRLRLGYVARLDHRLQHLMPALVGKPRTQERVVLRRRLRQPREERLLGEVELPHRPVEEHP